MREERLYTARCLLVETRQKKVVWGLVVQLEVFTLALFSVLCLSVSLYMVPDSPKSRGFWVQSLQRINAQSPIGAGVAGHSLL